jgi:peptide deformylase
VALLQVVKYGDSILRRKVDKVIDFSQLDNLIDDIFTTTYNESGIDLATNQVGVSLAVLLFNIGDYELDKEEINEDEFTSTPRVFN